MEEKETLVRGFRLVSLKAITLLEAQYILHPGSTYAALLLLVPFATTAPPLAWVPLAPIPKFGSGNSINNIRARRGNVYQGMTGDFPLCPSDLKEEGEKNTEALAHVQASISSRVAHFNLKTHCQYFRQQGEIVNTDINKAKVYTWGNVVDSNLERNSEAQELANGDKQPLLTFQSFV